LFLFHYFPPAALIILHLISHFFVVQHLCTVSILTIASITYSFKCLIVSASFSYCIFLWLHYVTSPFSTLQCCTSLISPLQHDMKLNGLIQLPLLNFFLATQFLPCPWTKNLGPPARSILFWGFAYMYNKVHSDALW
jgi:hypothetical protein